MYSCVVCGLEKIKVIVPARLDPDKENVEVWMNKTIALVGKDHQQKSPQCTTKHLRNLMIPIENAGWIGGPQIT